MLARKGEGRQKALKGLKGIQTDEQRVLPLEVLSFRRIPTRRYRGTQPLPPHSRCSHSVPEKRLSLLRKRLLARDLLRLSLSMGVWSSSSERRGRHCLSLDKEDSIWSATRGSAAPYYHLGRSFSPQVLWRATKIVRTALGRANPYGMVVPYRRQKPSTGLSSPSRVVVLILSDPQCCPCHRLARRVKTLFFTRHFAYL